MNGDTVTPAVTEAITWGADFWQKVLISGLGAMGSLLVALAVLLMSRRVAARERQREKHEKFAQSEMDRYVNTATQLVTYISEFIAITAQPVTKESQERYHDSIARLMPVASEGLYQFRGTKIASKLRTFLELIIEHSQQSWTDADERLQGQVKSESFSDVLAAHKQEINLAAIRLHHDLIVALETLEHLPVEAHAPHQRFWHSKKPDPSEEEPG